MLDFALHGWDVVVSLGLSGRRPVLVGHSMGGMLAAEMACLAPDAIAKLVLVNAYGLWLDDEPIPDIFAFLPFEFGDYLFHSRSERQGCLPAARMWRILTACGTSLSAMLAGSVRPARSSFRFPTDGSRNGCIG